MKDLYMCEYHRDHHHTRELEECYNIKKDELEHEDNPRKIKI